ncbi:MAG: NADH:ubiquinone reductase (Na(+)-transporting) subunit C [Bacteroidales bacterium]|nr:NADH:ubiquinone reductase (Na(+)-transporting) subunit C [Lentimicrobiaceae bacterium]MDD5695705.1 NADH:ubiquinone reductase (Na(+)-transporting) subunit C [Bacteroidales bacterium]
MSNTYIFRYAVILVVLVAVVLSTASMILKPLQDKNVAIAKMRGILEACNLRPTAENAVQLYDELITQEIVINQQSEEISIYDVKQKQFIKGESRAFEIDLKAELKHKAMNQDYVLPLYKYVNQRDTFLVIPIHGRGLWGPIYGNIALMTDMNTIGGAKFSHDKETPGLGAEIDQYWFSDQYKGKKLFDEDGKFISVRPVKGGVDKLPENMRIHGVDAVSGGTITSNGLGNTFDNVLESYVVYLTK